MSSSGEHHDLAHGTRLTDGTQLRYGAARDDLARVRSRRASLAGLPSEHADQEVRDAASSRSFVRLL